MGDENSTVRDLFGDEVYLTAGRKGRPPFQRTQENANKVNMLLAVGWSNERIASAILDPRTGKAISVPTLKRHFRSELDGRLAARDRLAARRLQRVWDLAESGNVGAEKLFGQLVEDEMREAAAARARRGADAQPVDKPVDKPLPKGKKDAAAAQAQSLFEGSSLLNPGRLDS